MFSGGNRSQAPKFWVTDDVVRIRPYNAQLNKLTAEVCTVTGFGSNNDTCMFETRTAFDCLLRKKVSKFGDMTDNSGACKHHI